VTLLERLCKVHGVCSFRSVDVALHVYVLVRYAGASLYVGAG
jgi:hypothetical protein